MKPPKRWVFSHLEKYIWRSVINERLFKWKSVPSRILCCDLCSLISVTPVLGARTNCTHYNHKECEPGKTASMLESGTGNQIGEVIRKKMLFIVERKQKVLPVYTFKSSMIQCEKKNVLLRIVLMNVTWNTGV